MFNANESGLDRAIRVVLGVLLLTVAFAGPKTLWGLLGFIPLITGAIGFCPLYRLLGISTITSRSRVAGS